MNNYYISYINILSAIVQYLHKDINKVDPIRINKAKFYARALFVAYCYAKNNSKLGERPTMSEIDAYLAKRFGASNLFCYLIKNVDPQIISIFEAETITVPRLSVSTLYENLLNVETIGKEVRSGKEYRNKLGSYYTPEEYAEEITRRTLEIYFHKKGKADILKAKIVDFSCGGGIFLISLLSVLRRNGFTSKEIKEIVKNIYAFDVDPIALEIAKISVLDYAGCAKEYESITNNFHHGNFLLHTQNEHSSLEKLETSMKGFIYHDHLAIGINFLQQYDIILGNPPWEKIRLEEKKFYAQYSENIDFVNFRFDLDSSIEEAHKNNEFIREYASEYKNQLETAKKKIRKSKFFKDATFGELNTCSLFADASYNLLSPNGCAGIFVKSALVTAKINTVLFNKLLDKLVSVFDFINTRKIFEIDGRERFSIIVLGNKDNANVIQLGMNLESIADIDIQSREVPISLFERLNPETRMIPNFSSGDDIKILSRLYQCFPVFSDCYGSVKYGRLVHLTNHVQDIQKEPNSTNIPVFEGKFFSLFDNAYSGFNDVPVEERYKSKASARKISQVDKVKGIKPLCRFYIKKKKWLSLSKGFDADYMLAWHSLTSATNTRTCVASLLPFIPGSQSVQFLSCRDYDLLIYLTGVFNSVVFDYIVKCKLNGIDLTQTVINQIPIPTEEMASSVLLRYKTISMNALDIIKNVVAYLYKEDAWLNDLFKDILKEESPLKELSRDELFILLDATVASIYKIEATEIDYILEKFKPFYGDTDIQRIKEVYCSITK